MESLIGEKFSHVKDLFNKITAQHEFEFMFYNFNNILMSYDKFITVMKYMKALSKNNIKLEINDTLDIIYNEPQTNKSYRISITGLDNINRYMKMIHNKKNHVIFNVFASLIFEGDKRLQMILKTKDSDNVIDLNELNIRVRLSGEVPLSQEDIKQNNLMNIDRDNIPNISFRLKDRITFYVLKDKDRFVRIDLTTTKTTKNPNKVDSMIPHYELELECGVSKPDNEIFNIMIHETEILLKVLQQSNYIITNTVSKNVIDEYAKILSLEKNRLTNLDARQAFSLEIQHVTENLPNKYAVTDKADGDRYQLIIVNNHVYLISVNMTVKDTGIKITDNVYNGTILDGELIFLPKKNRYIYMVFDCLFNGTRDIRKITSFVERLKYADDVIKNCFIFGKQTYYQQNDFNYGSSSSFNLLDIIKFHTKQIQEYMNDLNKNIDLEKQFTLIRRKYFIAVLGAKPWEIFSYSTLLYDKFTQDPIVKCPYLLDGLIYHPLDQGYITNVKESNLVEYKWKPPNKNSIDFFIEFEKDKDTGKVLTIYDNSVDKYVRNKTYKICHLYVGQRNKAGEQPVLFRPEQELFIAYIFLNNGEVRDLDGNIIMDRTVVEFYYNNDADVDVKFRWIPIRTRYDKTESVLRYRKRYGNYIDVANKVWRSIINPILITDMQELSLGGDVYETKINNLRSRVTHELIVSSTKENVYYQLKTNLAKPMRNFHNWIKSIIIYTYCNPMYQQERQLSILDIACGRGGDIMKFYYSKVLFYVGIDVDKDGLLSAVDGAVSRYTQLRKTHPNFPEMTFIQADASGILAYDDQNRILGGMDNNNRKNMERFFSIDPNKRTYFDRINCQFAIHYFLKNEDTWKNLKQNLNMYLKAGGYFMVTVFDGNYVTDLFKDNNNKYTVYYTDQRGNKRILFEIIKRYDDKVLNKTKIGNAIDLYVSWMFKEGQYITEYIVDYEFIVNELKKDCDLELVDSDLFVNLYEVNRDYFKYYAQYDDNLETRKFLLNVANYYDSNDINEACFKYSQLERYYVFRKRDKSKRQIGGNSITKDVIIRELDTDMSKNTYTGSIYHILKSHKLIPKSITLCEFISDFDIPIIDNELNDDMIQELNKKIRLDHIISNDNKDITVLNGITSIVLEKDCNQNYDVDIYNEEGTKCIVLLREGESFKPIYYSSDKGMNGIFDIDDDFIKLILKS